MNESNSKPCSGRDWPEDYGEENGNYQCNCCACEEVFTGNKHRVLCKLCQNVVEASPTLASQPDLESYNPLPHGIGCCCRLCSPPLSTPLLDGEEDYSSLPKATSAGSTPRAVASEEEFRFKLQQRDKAPRNWTEDYLHDNGLYNNTCAACGNIFTGNKHRVICKVCATTTAPSVKTFCARCDGEEILQTKSGTLIPCPNCQKPILSSIPDPAPETGGKTPLEIYDAARFDAVTKSTLPMPMATGVGHIEALEAVAAHVRKEEADKHQDIEIQLAEALYQLALERSEKADLLEALNEERQSNYSVAVSKLRKEIEAEKSAHETNLRLLRDLLAVIHGDGGHYVVTHGLAKAAEDAMISVPRERVAHEETRKRISDSFPFPLISAGSADALAYQFEVGRENHSCPMDDTTIAEWLRDCAKKLRTLNQPGEKK